MLAVWEHCRKGSLFDIIHNNAIALDDTFKASFIRDVVHGLEFLHRSPVGVHGQLTSENCLVDTRSCSLPPPFGSSPFPLFPSGGPSS